MQNPPQDACHAAKAVYDSCDMSLPGGQFIVRPAGNCDVPRLCELLHLLFTLETDFEPDRDKQSRALHQILDQPHTGRILCAVDGESVVGMVSLLYTVSTAEGGRAAWLEDLVVHPSRRGRGIGEQLLDAAIAEARNTGCLRLTLLTDSDNDAAHRLYHRAGFCRSQMLPMRLKL